MKTSVATYFTATVLALPLLLSGCGGRGGYEAPLEPRVNPVAASSIKKALGGDVERVVFDNKGEAELRGRVVGAENDIYAIAGKPGDTLSVTLEPSNQALYFEVLRTWNGASMFDAGNRGVHSWLGGLPAEELYLVRVYLYHSAVRYNERADYSLLIGLQPPTLSGRPLR